jgi:hypothetical protein
MAPAVAAAKEMAKVDNSWGQRIYDTLFGSIRPLVDQLPVGWSITVRDFTVRRIGDLDCNLPFSFTTPQPWPHQFPDTELASEHVKLTVWTGTTIRLKSHPAWDELFAEVSVKQKRVEEAIARQRKFVSSVRAILDTYTTLNQACEAWPPLRELVPRNIREQLDSSTGRIRLKVRPDVDMDMLTAMLTAAKLGV